MSDVAICPECGKPRADHAHEGGVLEDSPRRELQFSRILNGTPWRQKPIAPPRDRDDIVPYD